MTPTAESLLTRLAGPDATLRDDQREAIEALVGGEKVLVVQRTGWGKSAVYWITTALRRGAGAGPTLVVSPLLALMRDQVEAAGRIGLRALTINSSNMEEWPVLEEEIRSGRADVILVSPERLNSLSFRSLLGPLSENLGMLVIDEAHCISDWGHDFRPDYRRIKDVLASLPEGVPVLATTATANERVSRDVAAQLGEARVLRGSLARESLDLAVVGLGSIERYAFCDELLEGEGKGILYTLTVADAERLSGYLKSRGHAVEAYTGASEAESRLSAERALKAGEVKALVATSALGMGFDDPDLSFVVHVGSPASPVSYYQQVGRAGRGRHAVGVMLPHRSDEEIWEYFESTAFPPESVVRRVLAALSGEAQSVPALVARTDVRKGRLEVLLKVLDVEGAVERVSGGWISTGREWEYDSARIESVRETRRAEAEIMRRYREGAECLMRLLQRALDEEAEGVCGHCSVCTGRAPAVPAGESVEAARAWLRGQASEIAPRKMWPSGVAGVRGKIGVPLLLGVALARGSDPGWSEEARRAVESGEVSEEVMQGVRRMLGQQRFEVAPRWIASVGGEASRGLAEGLSRASGLPYHDVVRVGRVSGSTSASRVTSALEEISISGDVPSGGVLLVADEVSSLWSITVAGTKLTEAGAGRVTPVALLHS